MPDANDERSLKPKYFGKYPGVVTDNTPTEGAHLAKVKVRVPSILEEDKNGNPQPIEVIARPCLPPGFFFVPEKGDHVWVEFAAGDLDTPIWVGVWYPDDKPPHTTTDVEPTEKHKVIRTKGGHVVTLDDDGGKIVVKDKHGNTLTMEQGKVSIVVPSGSIQFGDTSDMRSPAALLMDSLDVQTYLTGHTHIGNLGVATGPPLPNFTATVSNWFTTITKAE